MGQCTSAVRQKKGRTENFAYERQQTPSLTIRSIPIFQDYEICPQVLGSGASGDVRVVRRRSDEEKFALKLLPACPEARREARLQFMCQHPNIVQIIDVYENYYKNTKYLFIILELMEGKALLNRVQRKRLTEREVAKIMHDLGSAVAHLHSLNVAHRDIKLENVLFNKDGVLKLADFGFARQFNDAVAYPLRTACYTSYYAPPEILQHVPYDKSCDMWSLGVVMYFLLCGYPPFYPEGNKELSVGMCSRIANGFYSFPSPEWDKVSEEAKNLVKKLLIPEPSKRLTIEKLMEDSWITCYETVPKTTLSTKNNINSEMLQAIEETMDRELTGMRVMYDAVMVKPLAEANNKLLMRRHQKTCQQIDNAD